MVLLIDIDNVSAKFLKLWLERYNKDFNDTLKDDDIKNYNVSKFIKSECSIEKFYSYLNEGCFFEKLEPMEYSQAVTQRLVNLGYQLYFVTDTPPILRTATYEKLNWVDEYFPHIGHKNVINTGKKFMVKGDLLFDDAPSNLQDFRGVTVAMHYAFNKDVDVDYRVNNWLEFESLIKYLYEGIVT